MFLTDALVAGVIATAACDAWQWTLRRGGFSTTNWGFVGRWIGSIPRGVFSHAAIVESPSVPAERWIGWSFHYFVGVTYAAIYLVLLSISGSGPRLLWTIGFGLATVISPWLILQPALGGGFFARKTPHPGQARYVSVTTHGVFGLGLYLGALAAGL
ncbi:MAG: DUF2938 family protein [Maricaulaceae bacterium]